MPVNAELDPSPINTEQGYNMVTFLPKFPLTHSMIPSFCTIARFVFKLYVFLLQFSILEYLAFAFFKTNISTQPACKLFFVYCGAEHPST